MPYKDLNYQVNYPSTGASYPMFYPMLLDCKTMTGVIYNCPNLSECLRNSRLNQIQALLLYLLNQGFKPEDIKVDGQPL